MSAYPAIDVWHSYLTAALPALVLKAKDNPGSGHVLGWSWAYLARSALLCFEHFNDRRFADLAADSIEEVLALRDDKMVKHDEVRGKVMKNWGCARFGGGMQGIWSTRITLAGRIGYPMVRLAELVQDRPELKDLKKRAESWISATIEGLGEFDKEFIVDSATGEGHYWWPGLEQVEPINHAHCAGEAYSVLRDITGERVYSEKVLNLSRFFLGHIRHEPNGSASWAYSPDPEDRSATPPELYEKGAITIQFVVEAYERGQAFDESLLTEVTNTFMKNVYRGCGRFNRRIGTDVTAFISDYDPRFHHLLSWFSLAQYEPKIADILKEAADNKKALRAGWFSTPCSIESLAIAMRTSSTSNCSHVHGAT